MISAIILAAGESSRMGQLKQLMTLGKGIILEYVIDNLLNSLVSEIIVVLGYKSEEVKKTIANKPVKIVVNPDYHQGMSTSIKTGLDSIDNQAKAVMIALGDQPYIDSLTINNLIKAFFTHNKGITIPVYQGRRGHPVIFVKKYIGELLKLKGDIGGREIITRHPDDVLEVAVNCEGILIDIDTMENYTDKILDTDKRILE